MTTPVRAALYLRVSTGRQADSNLSIPDQRRQNAARTLFRIGLRSMCSIPDGDAECVLAENSQGCGASSLRARRLDPCSGSACRSKARCPSSRFGELKPGQNRLKNRFSRRFSNGEIGQVLEKLGGRTRARTWDPMIKSHLLYQLSYAPGTGPESLRKRASFSKATPRCPAAGEVFPAQWARLKHRKSRRNPAAFFKLKWPHEAARR